MNQDNHSSMQKEQHGQRSKEKTNQGDLTKKAENLTKEKIQEATLRHQAKKVGNPRRASFCARMKGMKKKLTSSKTANDPDSRINKSLRKPGIAEVTYV